jgi:hypothetical protein
MGCRRIGEAKFGHFGGVDFGCGEATTMKLIGEVVLTGGNICSKLGAFPTNRASARRLGAGNFEKSPVFELETVVTRDWGKTTNTVNSHL